MSGRDNGYFPGGGLDRENNIHVTVNNAALPNTRWYSGSGIYRHVWLMVGGSVHITPWRVFAVTPEVSPGKSIANVRTKVENSGKIDMQVWGGPDVVSSWIWPG